MVFIFLLLLRCSDENACEDILTYLNENNKKQACGSIIDWQVMEFETLFIVDSNLYPDEISHGTGVKYNYKMHYDPNKVLLYIRQNVIVNRKCGRCDHLEFSPLLKKNGIVKVSKGDCLLARKLNPNDWFVYPLSSGRSY